MHLLAYCFATTTTINSVSFLILAVYLLFESLNKQLFTLCDKHANDFAEICEIVLKNTLSKAMTGLYDYFIQLAK